MIKQNVPLDVAIIGAGPAGLEAGLQAKKAGLAYIVIEKDDAGSLISQTMLEKRFYHKYGNNQDKPQGLLYFPDRVSGRELVEGWHRQARKLNLEVACGLEKIKKEKTYYQLFTDKGRQSAKTVIIATGTFSKPRALGVLGEANNPKLFYKLDYSKIPLGEKVVVVGGGNSAVETALESALDNELILIVRGEKLDSSVTAKNRADLENDKNIKIFWQSQVTKINPSSCQIRTPQGNLEVPYDTLYVNIGYESPVKWLQSLGIATDSKGKVKLDKKLQTSLPRVYAIGALAGATSIVQSANQAIATVSGVSKMLKEL